MTPLNQPFTDGETAAGIFHVGGRIPTGEAAGDILGIQHPYPHDPDALRRKVAHFFGFGDIQQLPWSRSGSRTIGLEGFERLRAGDPGSNEGMFRGNRSANIGHIMKGRLQRAATMPLASLELQIAMTVFQLSKALDDLIIHEDNGTVRRVSQRERYRIQELIGHLFDLPGMAE